MPTSHPRQQLRPVAGFLKEISGEQWEPNDTSVDVIVVSAVGADCESTWRVRGDKSNKTWIEEDLLKQLPIARIFFYDHGQPNDDEGLDQLAEHLLRCTRNRDRAYFDDEVLVAAPDGSASLRSPPLVFICHSTGGLIVQRALLCASQDWKYTNILISCIGVTFFAVPHAGSTLLSNPEFSKIAQSSFKIPNAESERCYRFPMSALLCSQVQEKCDYLSKMSDDFSSLMRSTPKIRIWSFYETIPTRFIQDSFDNTFVVSENIAGLTLADPDSDSDSISDIPMAERHSRIPLPCDHYGTASFDKANLDEYAKLARRPVRSSISRYLDELQNIVSGVFWPCTEVLQTMHVDINLFYRSEMGKLELEFDCQPLSLVLKNDFARFLNQRQELPKAGGGKNNWHGSSYNTDRTAEQAIPNGHSGEPPALTSRETFKLEPILRQQSNGTAEAWGNSKQADEKKKKRVGFGTREYIPRKKSRVEGDDAPAKEAIPEENRCLEYRFRWLHTPCTHTGWAEKLLRSAAKTSGKKSYRQYVQDDGYWSRYWAKKQNCANHEKPHGRFLHSTCDFNGVETHSPLAHHLQERLTPEAASLLAQFTNFAATNNKHSKEIAESGNHGKDSCSNAWQVMHIPYLHWESYEYLMKRQRVIEERLRYSLEPLKVGVSVRAREPESPNQTEARIFSKLRTTRRTRVEQELLHDDKESFKKLMQDIQSSQELKLIWEHLDSDSQLHCRRSLDQYMYSTLPDTSARDGDQVLHKCTKESVLVVDQLWMWVLDDATVVTCFQPKDVKDSTKSKLLAEGDLRACIRQEMNKDLKSHSDTHWDLAALIVKNAVTVIFDRIDDSGSRVLRVFGDHIEEIVEKQTQHWDDFYRRNGVNRDYDSDREIKQLFQDLRDLRELRDVEDELRIIDKVLEDQTIHIEKMRQTYEEVLGLYEKKGARYLRTALTTIEQYRNEVSRMIEHVKIGQDASSAWIDLQQKQISIDEAIAARNSADVAAKQSQVVTVFTVFTVFFLPLSFFTSLFGMNIREWGGNPQNLSILIVFSTMVPISVVVIVGALLIAMNTKFRNASADTFDFVFECVIIGYHAVCEWKVVKGIQASALDFSTAVADIWPNAWKRPVYGPKSPYKDEGFRDRVRRHRIERLEKKEERELRKRRERELMERRWRGKDYLCPSGV